jgi:hypothetical protein
MYTRKKISLYASAEGEAKHSHRIKPDFVRGRAISNVLGVARIHTNQVVPCNNFGK